MRPSNQDALMRLLDVYQRQAGAALMATKAVHDLAFTTGSSIDDHSAALANAGQALVAAHHALLAVHNGSTYQDPEALFVPAMSEPIVLAQ